jgi:hypothetical protein
MMVRSQRRARPLVGLALATAALAALAPPARAVPLISEVFYDAVGSDDGLGFVELYGSPGTPLDGLAIEVVNGSDGSVVTTLSLAGAIGPDGLFVVADRFADGTTAVVDADLLLNFDIQNGPDSVVLRATDVVLDALGFGDFAAAFFAGEGTPAPDVPAGSSLARRFANVDTGDNALDFVELTLPTPGSAPLAPIPEPSLGALSSAGLVGLALASRRRSSSARSRRWTAPHA